MSKLTALRALEDYSRTHEEGNTLLRKSVWNITKARQSKNGLTSLTSNCLKADDVREDLIARFVVNEDFWLVDVIEVGKENASAPPALVAEADTGLRQRKAKNATTGGVAGAAKESEWKVETHNQEPKQLIADPIDLFGGLPPRQLKEAQQQAKEALAKYVLAAKELATILECMKEKKNESATNNDD
jgi:hypothetical protein